MLILFVIKEKNMENRIFLRPSDIKVLEGVKDAQASRIYQLIRDVYNKRKEQKVLIAEYAEYREVPLTIIKGILKIS